MFDQTIIVTIVGTLLVFVLTPGLLVRIPKNGSLKTVAMVHALAFGAVFFLLQYMIREMMDRKEGLPKTGGSCGGGKGSFDSSGKCVYPQATNKGTTTTGAKGATATKKI